MPSNSIILANAPIACVLAQKDIDKGTIWGQRIDTELAGKIFFVYTIVKKIYDLDPNYDGMDAACLYLWEIMGKYGIEAQAYTGGGGAVAGVSGSLVKSPILVLGSDFTSATEWDGANGDGITIQPQYTLQVFWNDVQIFLREGTDWNRTATGIEIIRAGFDAATNPTYELYIYISL